MPNQKFKSEQYTNFGGINSKASEYITGPTEFLDLKNWDFQTPGSLSQRWGSTQYISDGFTSKITGFVEYEKFNGESFVVVTSSTFAFKLAGTGYTTIRGAQTLNTNIGQATQIIMGWSSNYDFQVFSNYLYACNGKDFWKYNGTSTTFYSLGKADFGYLTSGYLNISYTAAGPFDTVFMPQINYFYKLAFVSESGHTGPISSDRLFLSLVGITATSIKIHFANFASALFDRGHGITGLLLYRGHSWSSASSQGLYYQCGDPNLNGMSGQLTIINGFQTLIIDSNIVQGAGVISPIDTHLAFPSASYYIDAVNSTYFYGITTNAGVTLGGHVGQSLVPKFLENFNNQLFMAGFSGAPSSIVWSEIGMPESVDPEFIAEFRTDDGDKITGMKIYNGNLVVFKSNSFFVLSGDDPDNFSIREVSTEYGCLSNRAIAVYNDIMLFLDRKGIVQFNGANFQVISNKIDPIFSRMNVAAALDQATMIHDKTRNQVILGIPVDGSSTNNLTVVYDYIVNAWTTYDGYNPAQYQLIQGRLDKKTIMFSDYLNKINYVGPTFASDNGVGFSLVAKTRYNNDMGKSVTKQYRRLFLDVDPITGTTVAFNINFFSNYGDSVALNRTMYSDQFQSRIDFGIPAKSLSFEISKFDTTTIVKWHGYTIESRFQRNV